MHLAALAARRKYWTRPDAYRFAPPGTPEAKMPGWLDPSATRVRLKEAQEEEARRQELAAQEEFERELLALRHDFAKLKLEYELRRFQQKYSPNQSRVPAGNPDGGQWASGGGASGGAPASGSDGQVLSDENPDPIRPGARYAQNEPSGHPIDLREEQQLGGHAIEGHVGKSQQFLLNRARELALSAERKGDFFQGFRVGSFSSLEAANKLVNATIAQNPAKIERITSGQSPREELVGRLDSITGYEAYMRNERAQPYIRETDGVVVVAIPDRRAAKGYRVDSAFPVRFGR
jgi:hypothetical protein